MAVAKQEDHEQPLTISESEYLEFEEQSEIKHEFVNGQVFAMSGGSVRHSFLIANTIGLLHAQLRGQNCGVMAPETRIKVFSKVSYRYPDETVLCDRPEYVDGRVDTISNPIACLRFFPHQVSSQIVMRNSMNTRTSKACKNMS